MQDVLGLYMLVVVLIVYIFHEMDDSSKDVPTAKVERKEDQWELGESNASSFKKSANKIKLEKRRYLPSLFIIF
ncbi:hypothetical protein [Priestia megaterium]|uniref:hypothetical protein n=1 Tax=Priestia megaterium TaxID=1404 RepID=UPI0018683015|nr:hypothetical protein [Priestia megaterium]MBE2978191.1 hypothetical protein [Priestia megaterium]